MVMCENYIKYELYISLYIVRIYHIGHSRVIYLSMEKCYIPTNVY